MGCVERGRLISWSHCRRVGAQNASVHPCMAVSPHSLLIAARCALLWRAVTVARRNAVLYELWKELRWSREHIGPINDTWDPKLPQRALDHYYSTPDTHCDHDERKYALAEFCFSTRRITERLDLMWQVRERTRAAFYRMQVDETSGEVYQERCYQELSELLREMHSRVLNYLAACVRPTMVYLGADTSIPELIGVWPCPVGGVHSKTRMFTPAQRSAFSAIDFSSSSLMSDV